MRSPECELAEELFPELLDADTVAEVMEVEASDVERWTDEGILKGIRVASTVRYEVKEVKNLVTQRQDLVGLHE